LLGPAHVLVGASASHLLADSPSLAAAGFDAFLPKPTPLAALADLVLRISKERESGVSLARAPSEPAEESSPTAHDLDLSRLTELAELRGPDGTPLLLRTLERVLDELPALERCLAEAPNQKGELRRSVHDLAGVFGLLGAKDARARALEFEDQLLLDSPPMASFEELSALTARLRRQVEARLRVLRSA
jgi:HPt (histidine-containing phosphotransfer) domain-containing protein